MLRRSTRLAAAALLSLALTACGAPGSAPTRPSLEARVDALFAPFDGLDRPGCAVGVFRAGEVLLARGYGAAHLEHRVPITRETVFDVASNAKQFTALAVLLLEQAGALSLDDDVRRHVPELPDHGATITLRHLLHNTSGLRCLGDLLELRGTGIDQPVDRASALELIGRQRGLNNAPGERSVYSNTNWLLLALVVERVDGRPFPQFLRDEVLKPLGMADTRVRDDPTSLIPGRAETYRRAPGGGYRLNRSWGLASGLAGMGFLHTTLDDLARWDENASSGRLGGRELVARWHERGRLADGTPGVYAAGLIVGRQLGLPAVFHGGAGGGSSELVRFPDQRLSVAVLCNQSHAEVDARELAVQVAELFLEAEGALGQVAATLAPAPAADPAALQALTGTWWIPEQARRTAFVVRDGVLCELSDGEALPLTSLGEGRFQDDWEAITFGPDGASGRGIHRPTGEPYSLVRWPGAFVAPDLSPYVGSFHSHELNVRWELREVEGTLWLTRGSAPAEALQAVKPDGFLAPGVLLEFQRDGAGAVVGLRVATSRVRGLDFRREEAAS